MTGESIKRSAAMLAAKFIVLAPICLVIWLLILPFYAQILGYAAASVFHYVLGYPITGVTVNAEGLLNTGTSITFARPDGQSTMPDLGKLVGNIAPFVALVLATPRLKLRRSLYVIAMGIIIIFFSHLLTLAVLPMARSPLQTGKPPLAVAVGFFSITLPFLLWIGLAYWGHLMAFLGDAPHKKVES